jgi:hypothetical protein
MSVYATGKRALECGAVEAFDMSLEATVAKLMWGLYRALKVEEIKAIMHHNYAGEINTHGYLTSGLRSQRAFSPGKIRKRVSGSTRKTSTANTELR